MYGHSVVPSGTRSFFRIFTRQFPSASSGQALPGYSLAPLAGLVFKRVRLKSCPDSNPLSNYALGLIYIVWRCIIDTPCFLAAT